MFHSMDFDADATLAYLFEMGMRILFAPPFFGMFCMAHNVVVLFVLFCSVLVSSKNQRLFFELYKAFKAGRLEKDPSIGWYEGEMGT